MFGYYKIFTPKKPNIVRTAASHNFLKILMKYYIETLYNIRKFNLTIGTNS